MINYGFVNANSARPSVFRAIREICGQRAIFARTDGQTTNDVRETDKRKEAGERANAAERR